MLNALNDKKIDAIADDALGNGFQARSNPQLSMIDITHTQESYAFAVSCKNTVLLLKLNENLKKLKENGSLQKVNF